MSLLPLGVVVFEGDDSRRGHLQRAKGRRRGPAPADNRRVCAHALAARHVANVPVDPKGDLLQAV
eukprot:1226198-Alexandrium_andersonii.AAC.1